MVNALVCSVLVYGSVIYACLSNVESVLTHSNLIFSQAEIFVRKMLRWAFGFDIDTRCSLMYIISNQTTLQVNAQKSVFRFFKSLTDFPRYCSKFIQNISSQIEPELLGISTITWWSNVQLQYGTMANTKPIYKAFRKCIQNDLSLSNRLKATGLDQIMLDLIKYCFSGEPFTPPTCAKFLLEKLLAPQHSICEINVRGRNCIKISSWPSWLTVGYKKHVNILLEMFYGSNDAEL